MWKLGSARRAAQGLDVWKEASAYAFAPPSGTGWSSLALGPACDERGLESAQELSSSEVPEAGRLGARRLGSSEVRRGGVKFYPAPARPASAPSVAPAAKSVRRPVLWLYGLVLPSSLAVLALSSRPDRRGAALIAVLALCLWAGWMWRRRALQRGESYLESAVRSISARHAAEAQQGLAAALLANMQEAVLVLDPALRVKLWSPAAERMFGWTSDEVVLASALELFAAREGASGLVPGIVAAAAGEEGTILAELTGKTGRPITVSMSLVALKDAAGAVSGVLCVGRDVTAEKAAEAALRESEERLSLALSASGTESWEWDVEQGRARTGPCWAEILGVHLGREFEAREAEELVRFVHAYDRAATLSALRRYLEGKVEAFEAEVRLPLEDGSFRWAVVHGRAVSFGAQGRATRLIGTARDVTARRLAEEERERLLEEARQATSAREQTLALVAHDLRNPLAAIRAAASGLDRALDEEDPRADLAERGEIIQQASLRMSHLIEDLLDVAALKNGGLRLSHCEVDAALLAREAVRAAGPLARRAGVSLEAVVGAAPSPLRCDPSRLQQVLGNLLSNALGATPSGGTVVLKLASEERAVRFSVVDTGHGFEAGQLERLFQPYQRGAGTRYKGAGLGLAIARGIVEGHGGRIWAESPQGGGAAVHFTVPLPMLGEEACADLVA